MKKLKYIGCLFAVALWLACSSDQKPKDVSDSALIAPVDTLGADTSRQNPVGDSVIKTDVYTAK
jgi:hypothetical protein